MPRFSRWLVIAFGVLLVLLIAGGAWFYRDQGQTLRRGAEHDLQAIARLKADQIVAWRTERLDEAAMLMHSPLFREAVPRWLAEPQPAAIEPLYDQLRVLQEYRHYSDLLLVDAQGQVRLSLSDRPGPVHQEVIQELELAFRTRRPVLTDLHTMAGLHPHIDAIAPFFAPVGGNSVPVGAILLRTDASEFLYPLIQSWPVPSGSAETLLVRRESDDVLFLNPLRAQADAALSLRIPLTEDDVPAVMAVLGREGVVEGRDYRGVPVLSVLQPIPASPWFMVAKVDRAEVLAPWRFRSALIIALILALAVGVAAAAALLWQHTLNVRDRALLRAEARYRITLLSIGDAVVVTDSAGRVELLNPVAEALTGWPLAEARGQSLAAVFQIVNEYTRAPAEDPVARVLREGTVVGLANHTVLLARDGREYPIADSAAPILDEQAQILGTVLVFRDQTVERNAQAAQQASEDRLRDVLENSRDAVYRRNLLTGTYDYISPAIERLWGFTPAELIILGGQGIEARIHPDDLPTYTAHMQALGVSSGPNPVDYTEYRWLTRAGAYRWFATSRRLIRDASGTPVAHIGSIRDIHEQKMAEVALRESEEKYRILVESANEGVIIAQNGILVYANRRGADMVGVPPAEVIGAPLAQFIHPEDRALVLDRHHRRMAGEDISPSYDFRLITAEGRTVWVQISATRLSWQGTPATLNMLTDITERKQAEEALRRSEAALRQAQRVAHVGSWTWDLQTDRLEWSEEMYALFGLDKSLFTGRVSDVVAQCVHPDDRAAIEASNLSALTTGHLIPMEYRIIRPDGTIRTLWGEAGELIRDAAGRPATLTGIALDITDLRHLEGTLREREARLRTLFEVLPAGVAIVNAQRQIIELNPALEAILGLSRDALLRGDHAHRQYLRGDGSPMPVHELASSRALHEHAPVTDVVTGIIKEDGSTIWTSVSAAPLPDPDSGVVVITADISARKHAEAQRDRLQDQLLQAHKMETVGRLAGGIAHDFNNLLTVINGYSDLLLDGLAPEAPGYAELHEIAHAGARAAGLTAQLLAFSRRQILEPRILDLNEELAGMTRLLTRVIGEDIRLVFSPAPDLGPVHADPTQLHQVVLNLAVNARDAMPQGGVLTLSTANVVLDAEHPLRDPDLAPGPYVLLTVSDTGTGMSDEVKSHLFEPFFTTKEVGHGTGLGLSTVYGIVKQSGGSIVVESKLGRGASFYIALPRVAAPAAEDQPVVASLPHGHETILLVEDNEAVRHLTARLLQGLGYRVIEAANAAETRATVEGLTEPLHLLLTDVVMPEGNGRELAEGLALQHPGLKVLFMSGYTDDAIISRGVMSESTHFIAKPFKLDALAHKVRAVLDGA